MRFPGIDGELDVEQAIISMLGTKTGVGGMERSRCSGNAHGCPIARSAGSKHERHDTTEDQAFAHHSIT
jgi:hypothetical protein